MARRALLALSLLLTLATCRDGFEPHALARIAVAPVLPSKAALAAFGLTIDQVRFVVVRPVSDTLADTTVDLPAAVTELALDLRVPLVTNPETLSVSVIALGGTIPLFAGTRLVRVPTTLPPEIPVTTYIGPSADSIVILPRSPFILLSDSLRFQVQGFYRGAPVTQFYVAWSSSDSAVAPISRSGVLRAPATRSVARVTARTPSGARDSVTATFTLPATLLVLIAGAGQSDIVGRPLATPLEVETRAADGLAVGGVTVRFHALAGGGSVSDTVVVTDGAGRARTTATLGNVLGGQSFQASVAGLGGSPVTFGTVAFAGTATQLVAIAGNLQSTVVGTAVAIDPAVRALDQFGNPVPGAPITFATKGAGGVTGPAQLTNGAGVATVGSWILGTAIGTDTLTATLSGLTPVTFTAKGIAGVATQIAQLAGDGQTAVVNTILPVAPAVIVRDQFNNPVSGIGVLFAPASGGGSVTGGSAVADTAGVARVGSWQLGTLVGQNTLTASASGLTGSPVLFAASATRDVAARLLRVSIDTQTSIVGQPVSTPPAVRVADLYGNPVPGAPVAFALTGALLGSLAPSNATTDSAGVARVASWTLATVAGLNTLDATATSLAGSPMTFSATGIITTATNMVLSAGNGQSAVVGTALATADSVLVTNAVGLPVQGVPVHWAVGSTGGSMNPPTSLTDVNGIASSKHTLGPAVGTQTATASVGSLTVTFSATALPDLPKQLVKLSGDPQSAIVATSVAAPPSVRAVDRFGNAVPGVGVTFGVIAGGGGVTGATVTTDGQGIATVGSWTLGTIAGTNNNKLSTSATGVPPDSFRATAVAGSPAQLAFQVPPSRSVAGDTMAPPVRVAVEDQYRNIDSTATNFVRLDFGKTAPFATISGINPVAASNGIAVFPDLAIDSASDPLGPGYTLVATGGTLTADTSNAFDIGGVIAAFAGDRLQPVAAAYNSTNGLVYAPGYNRTLGVLDPFKGPISQLQILPDSAFGVAVNALTNRVYVTTFGLVGAVVVIDASNNLPLVTIPLAGQARGVAVDEATDRIYVAVAADTVKRTPPSLAIIDGKDPRVIATIPFREGGQAAGVAFNPKDRLVYVAIPDLGVGVFDPATLAHVTTLPIVGGKGAAGTHGVVVDVPANLVYATNRAEHTFSVIDPVGLKELDRISVGALPEGLGVDRGTAYVANSGTNTVSFIHQDPNTGRYVVFATLIVGPAPKAAAVNPGNGHFYVPTFGDDRIRVVQP